DSKDVSIGSRESIRIRYRNGIGDFNGSWLMRFTIARLPSSADPRLSSRSADSTTKPTHRLVAGPYYDLLFNDDKIPSLLKRAAKLQTADIESFVKHPLI